MTTDTRSKVVGILICLPAILVVSLLFIYPFFLSFIESFKVEGQWKVDNYIKVFELYSGDFVYTLIVAFSSLFILLLVGVILGGYLRLRHNKFIEFLFKIPLFIPFVVVGHAMRVFLAPNGTLNSFLASLGLISLDSAPSIAFSSLGVVIALSWKNLSLALLLMMGAFRSIDYSYVEAARNVGASYIRIIFTILLPMAKGAVAVSAILIFTSILGNFSIPIMLGNSNGAQMIMVDIYYQIIYQNDYGVANAIGVLSYLISMGAAIYYLRVVTK
ncbi:ABC transporter permease [Chengkuizengella sediminis]|uniref:ABC transporter permease n=1 Tax=Chengkuizengella sediminis TaxID=1885917 RepID=UPI001389FD5D|nr:ABC transporter permease subunit [Chengkuizengella sediminis]NDI34929.1 ABC transporter permease subunit [Chengkuizengella sediminis]